MPVRSQQAHFLYGLLVAVLLILGQNAAAYHPGDHGDGTARNATCAACIVINLMSSACVDTSLAARHESQSSAITATHEKLAPSVEPLAPRQRAPPVA